MGSFSKACFIVGGLSLLAGAAPLGIGLIGLGAVCSGSRRRNQASRQERAHLAREMSRHDEIIVEQWRQERRPGERGIEIERVIEEVGPLGSTREIVVDRKKYYF